MRRGIQKYIKTPEKMFEHFEAYKLLVKATPVKVQDYVGKDGTKVDRERERPLSMEGFYNYLDTQGIITDATDYFENKENRYADFIRVCARIKRIIREDQITGGLVGIYNPSITQRLNNLTEKSQTEVSGVGPIQINVLPAKGCDPLIDA